MNLFSKIVGSKEILPKKILRKKSAPVKVYEVFLIVLISLAGLLIVFPNMLLKNENYLELLRDNQTPLYIILFISTINLLYLNKELIFDSPPFLLHSSPSENKKNDK